MMKFPHKKHALALAFALVWGALPLAAQAQGSLLAASEAVPAAPITAHLLARPKVDTTYTADADESGMIESDRLAAEAIKLVWENRLKDASEKINAALRLRVDRSYYHLINGLIYHLQARQGENAAYDLAEQGYQRAIHFDSSNWQAYYFAGLLNVDTSKFDKARQQLAEALYYRPDDPAILNAFAYAAYRSGAPDLAAGAVNAMEAMGGPQTAVELRNAAMIMAAVGEKEKAQSYLDRFMAAGNERQGELVKRRVAEWNGVYSQPRFIKTQIMGGENPAAGNYAAGNYGGGNYGGGNYAGGNYAAGNYAAGNYGGGNYAAGNYGGMGYGALGSVTPTAPGTESKMVVVDVVLISTEEDFSTAKGVNLLRGLQIQFGNGANTFAYSKNRSSSSADSGDTHTTAITSSLTIPAITYSLNIFNSNNQRNEILARPTLVATAGLPSVFFSGVELNAVVVNSSNNSSASPVNIQKEIGVSLSVTPSFLNDGRVGLKVAAQRTFIKTPNSNLTGFDARVETSKSKVDANLVMRHGETLIMGGLSEKEAENTRDGVPLLQDLPLVQYLFARNTTRDYQKSTLILITPRPPQYVYQPEKAQQEYEKSLSEDERPLASLRARYADWFKPYPNWASVFHHMQENTLYREFRTGDVALENWADMRTLKDRLGKVLDFLYY